MYVCNVCMYVCSEKIWCMVFQGSLQRNQQCPIVALHLPSAGFQLDLQRQGQSMSSFGGSSPTTGVAGFQGRNSCQIQWVVNQQEAQSVCAKWDSKTFVSSLGSATWIFRVRYFRFLQMVKDLDILPQSNMSRWDISYQWSFCGEMIYERGIFHWHVWLLEGIVHGFAQSIRMANHDTGTDWNCWVPGDG